MNEGVSNLGEIRQANSTQGETKAFIHITGYAFDLSRKRLAWLLKDERWRQCGFETIEAFAASLRFEPEIRVAASQRKELALLFKQADKSNPISNRKIADALNVNPATVDRDVAAFAAPDEKKTNRNNGGKVGGAAFAAPTLLSGAEAAKIVERRSANVADTQARRAERERELGAKILALPEAKFGVIVADPEWHDDVYSEETGMSRHASRVYTTSDFDTIKARPVASIAADDSVLFLWSTNQHLRDAIAVMEAWGFEYRSNYVWRKPTVGLGYWNRSVHELLLIGARGVLPCPALGTQWESVIDAPRGEVHSAKPEIFLQMIEQYFPTLPKIELNRRGAAREGWTAWGAEAEAAQ